MKEESTSIKEAIILRADYLKRWVLVPLFSVLTCFIFLLVLYWKIPMRKKWLYKHAESVEESTHLYIESNGKFSYEFHRKYFACRWKHRNCAN